MWPLALVLVCVPPLVFSACGSSGGSGGGGGSSGNGGSGGGGGSFWDGGPDAPTEQPKALLDIYPLDLWAQFLPQNEMQMTVTQDGAPVYTTGSPVVTVPLVNAGAIQIDLSAPEHEPLSAIVSYDGGSGLDGAVLLAGAAAAGQGLSLAHEMRDINGVSVPVHSVFLGLRHKWFSAEGRPARRGNQVTFLQDGEQAWGSVAQDLKAAKNRIMAATWWWQSDFELYRDPQNHPYQTQNERWPNTILGILEQSPAEKRILVGQFWSQDSILAWMTTDSKLKAYAEAPGDGFEFMGQANETKGQFHFALTPFTFGDRVRSTFTETQNEQFDQEAQITSTVPERDVDLTLWPVSLQTQAASFHQKFMVIDDELAYIGGMNLKEVDWDTSKHLVFEPRRMLFDATQADRLAVVNKEQLPDQGPRKDYMVRIDGPAAQDAADIFHERWQHQLDSKVDYSENSTPFTVKRDIPERPNGIQMQVTATLPQPFWEHAIAETWFNAVNQAENYIYIEDQYFRVPMLNEAIEARMQAKPNLRLIVITKPINEYADPGCVWTYKSHELFKNKFGSRYMMLQLRAFDTVEVSFAIDETESRFADMDVHAKMLIVDDKFMSVGSCNKNNRGIVYEGELNVAVLDAAWVHSARQQIFANMLPAGTQPTDDVATWWKQFQNAAAWNDGVYSAWDAEGGDINLNGAPLPDMYTPEGFVYSLNFGPPSDCLFESVGPDMTLY